MFTEQVPKFTVNALRAVDLQGHDWWLPFFDDEFLAFWERVPDDYRLGERLHCDFTDDLFRRVTGTEPPARERKAKYGTATRSPGVGGVQRFARNAGRALYYSFAAGWFRRRRQEALWARDYKDNPMGWYALFPESQYLDMAARGAAGINGMLAETYLNMIGAWPASGRE
jgi:asparagine synthase (glutamine-hydrolysing)